MVVSIALALALFFNTGCHPVHWTGSVTRSQFGLQFESSKQCQLSPAVKLSLRDTPPLNSNVPSKPAVNSSFGSNLRSIQTMKGGNGRPIQNVVIRAPSSPKRWTSLLPVRSPEIEASNFTVAEALA